MRHHRHRRPVLLGTQPTRSVVSPHLDRQGPDPTPAAGDSQPSRPATPETTDTQQQHRAEYAALGAAIHDHPRGSRAQAQACITLDDLTRPDIRAAWTAIGHLQATGLPVDEITVYWQLTHTATASPRIPTIAMLRHSRDAAAPHNDAIRTLTAASATRALTRLRTTLQALQADQRPLTQTIDAITTSSEDVRHQTHRIHSIACYR